MNEIPEKWLHEFNRKMGDGGTPYAQRPFEAIRAWTKENHCSFEFPSPAAKAVFDWFEAHSPKVAHAVGSLFTGTFYFDAYFWKVSIPLAYGNAFMNAFDSIEDFPEPVKKQLMDSRDHQFDYCSLWVDLMDYTYGMDDLRHGGGVSGFAARLATSADRELRATVRLLTEPPQHPNPKAMESARMATEMFLKAYLAAHSGLNESDAQRQLGHNLVKAAETCERISKPDEFGDVKNRVSIFPPVGARYEGQYYDSGTLWAAYCIAQFVGTVFVRSLTDRDSRAQMFSRMQTNVAPGSE